MVQSEASCLRKSLTKALSCCLLHQERFQQSLVPSHLVLGRKGVSLDSGQLVAGAYLAVAASLAFAAVAWPVAAVPD